MCVLKTVSCLSPLAVLLGLGAFLPFSYVTSARAGVVVTALETGGDVVLTSSGSLDLTELHSPSDTGFASQMAPESGVFITGSVLGVDEYQGIDSFPASFGTGSHLFASSSSGDTVGVWVVSGMRRIYVSDGYVSGSAISGSSTYAGKTFASLGLTPGSYEWTWGESTANADSLTLNIQAATVPEPSTFAMMGLGLIGIAGYSLRRRPSKPRDFVPNLSPSAARELESL